jgi:hypothetical protein
MVTRPTVADDYTPTTGEVLNAYGANHWGRVDAADRWLAAHDREVAAKALREAAGHVQRALPGLLIEDSDSEDGWLSDAQNAQIMADHYAVSFCGEGSIDVHQIASIAAVLIEKGAGDE